MKRTGFSSRLRNWLPHTGGLVAVLVFGSIGVHILGTSSAATATYNHNPQGTADYCLLEGTTTVIYGWAADADAPAGPLPNVSVKVGSSPAVTVSSSIAGYRDAAINAYIKSTNPGAPTSTTYGWKLSAGTLYKGGSYTISGTLINYSTGVNIALPINSGHNVDGNTSEPYFAGNVIPDACLAAKPVAPAPLPQPAPTPAPVHIPVKTAPKVVAPTPAAPTISNASDATVLVGTTAASFSIPAGNAASTYILYGTDPNNLNHSSDIQTLSGDLATVTLQALDAKTTYTYQIVRTLGDKNVNSANGSFTTEGYSVALVFNDKNNKPVSGVATELGSKKAKSNNEGTVTFGDLAAGAYSPIFTYNSQSYSQDFNTSSAATQDGTKAIVLSQTINVDNLAAHKTTAKPVAAKKPIWPLLLLILVAVLLIGGFIFFWLRRRSESYGSYPLPSSEPLPHPVVVDATVPAQIPTPAQPYAYSATPVPVPVPVAPSSHAHTQTSRPAPTATPLPSTPAPEHMGESLRDMVLQSMAEEAAKHPHTGPKPPVVPGQS